MFQNYIYDIDIKLSSSCGNKFYSSNIPYTNIFCNITDKEGKDITSQYSLKWNVEGIKELIEVNQRNNIDNAISMSRHFLGVDFDLFNSKLIKKLLKGFAPPRCRITISIKKHLF